MNLFQPPELTIFPPENRATSHERLIYLCTKGLYRRKDLPILPVIIIISNMANMLGYLATWTIYGTWLQGDERGYVKNGKILTGDKKIKRANQRLQGSDTTALTKKEREIVYLAIITEAKKFNHNIKALAVCSNHVHLAAESRSESIEQIISRYKSISASALRKNGRNSRIWTRGFDKRFCFTEEDFLAKINYVNNHNK